MSSPRTEPDALHPGTAGDRPAAHVRNTADRRRSVSVVCRRGGDPAVTLVDLDPGETVAVALPAGDGPATVECHLRHDGRSETAMLTVPDDAPAAPLFCIRPRTLLVASS